MGRSLKLTYLPVFFWISILVLGRSASSLTTLFSCHDFQDRRQNTTVSRIVVGLTANNTQFQITKSDPYSTFNCKESHEKRVSLLDTETPLFQSKVGLNEQRYNVWKSKWKNLEYFTTNGDYYDGHQYFQQSEYCTKSLTETEIILRLCHSSCEAQNNRERYCIPKCCAPDEVLRYWDFRCRKLQPGEPNWQPVVCKSGVCKSVNSSDSIHFKGNPVSCDRNLRRRRPLATVTYDRDGDFDVDEKENVMLDVSFGKGELLKLERNRKWKQYDLNYCVDGFVVYEDSIYEGNSDHQVFLTCLVPKNDSYKTKISIWISINIMAFASIFLIAIILVHFALIQQIGFNGFCILCYSISLLMYYILIICSLVFAMHPNRKATGLGNRGLPCFLVAVVSHSFLFANGFWLTSMNLNLLTTVRSSIVVKGSSKQLRKFALHSLIAWGIPFILIVAFVTLDEIYRDPLTYAIVPDYAVLSCTVASWSRGYFIYMPLAIILVLNGIFILLTLKVVLAEKQKSSMITRHGKDIYRVSLFLKLFCIMGTAWAVRMVVWYFDDGNGTRWYIAVPQMAMLLQPIPLFGILCCNQRISSQIQKKYPGVVAAWSFVFNKVIFGMNLKCTKGTKTEST